MGHPVIKPYYLFKSEIIRAQVHAEIQRRYPDPADPAGFRDLARIMFAAVGGKGQLSQ